VTRRPLRVHVIASRPRLDRVSPLVPELVTRLRELGHQVRTTDPDIGATDLSRVPAEADLHILKSGTEAALLPGRSAARRRRPAGQPVPGGGRLPGQIVQTAMLAGAGATGAADLAHRRPGEPLGRARHRPGCRPRELVGHE
jgi:hypothetical protein